MESPKDIRRRVASIRALPPVDATGVEAVSDKKTAKKLFGDFGCVRNASDGYEVRFPKESVGKILRHRGFDQTSILAVLDKVFVSSLWAWDDPVRFEEGKKRHRNFSRYRNYVGKVLSGEQVLFVRFTITETRGDGNLVHSTFVSDVRLYEDKSAKGLSTPDNNRAKVASALLMDDRLANWLASVNGGVANRRPGAMFAAEALAWMGTSLAASLLATGLLGWATANRSERVVLNSIWGFITAYHAVLALMVHFGFRKTVVIMSACGWLSWLACVLGISCEMGCRLSDCFVIELALSVLFLLPCVLMYLPQSGRWLRSRRGNC